MLRKFSGEENTENLYGRDRQVPAVKNCRFTQTAFGTVIIQGLITHSSVNSEYQNLRLKLETE